MKAIVHIGSPKAGSSSIQRFLFQNTEALARQGLRFHRNVAKRGSQFEYPMALLAREGEMIRGRAEQLRYHARTLEEQRASSEPYAAELMQYAKRWKEPTALFSSEHILPWLLTEDRVRAFDDMFRQAFSEVRYIVYFRDQADMIVSQYSERMKQGRIFTLDTFISKRLPTLDIMRPADRWRTVVGAERLDVRLLDRGFLHQGDLLQDFCHACGIDITGLEIPPRVNEALSAPGAECVRMLNRLIPDAHPEGGRNPLRAQLIRTVASVSGDLARIRLNPKQKALVDEQLAQPNEAFRQAFFPDRDPLFTPSSRADIVLSRGELREQALEVMGKVFVKARLGEMRPLSARERKRAVVSDDLTGTAEDAVA